MAGIAAMLIAGALGAVMGLNETATFMAASVAFVGVALWTDGWMTRRRREARSAADSDAADPAPSAERARDPHAQQRDAGNP